MILLINNHADDDADDDAEDDADDDVVHLVRWEHSHEVVEGVFDLAEQPWVAQELDGKCQ